ncbi:MAG: hypothetical protein U0231_20430 [Nitrospiraceae bacterium]
MKRLGKLSVRYKLMLLMGLFVVGFGAFALVGLNTLEELKVTGPIYRHIVEGKTLPPMFSLLRCLSYPET